MPSDATNGLTEAETLVAVAWLDDANTLLCVRCRNLVVDRAELYHCHTATGLCICTACWSVVTSVPPVGPADLKRALALASEA